jgi:hypothetical protein
MKYTIALFLAFSFILNSCKKETTQDETKSSFQEVYQMSEMALLMEEMYVELDSIRPKLIENKPIGEFPQKFEKIDSAKMTETFARTNEFKNWSNLLIQNFHNLYESDSNRIENYNNVVKTCISCHKSDAGCIGPVSRISKLLIPQDFK